MFSRLNFRFIGKKRLHHISLRHRKSWFELITNIVSRGRHFEVTQYLTWLPLITTFPNFEKLVCNFSNMDMNEHPTLVILDPSFLSMCKWTCIQVFQRLERFLIRVLPFIEFFKLLRNRLQIEPTSSKLFTVLHGLHGVQNANFLLVTNRVFLNFELFRWIFRK